MCTFLFLKDYIHLTISVWQNIKKEKEAIAVREGQCGGKDLESYSRVCYRESPLKEHCHFHFLIQ